MLASVSGVLRGASAKKVQHNITSVEDKMKCVSESSDCLQSVSVTHTEVAVRVELVLTTFS